MNADKLTIALWQNFLEVYEFFCRPICKKYGLMQPSLDILMFLHNNPEMKTAKEISLYRGMKRSIVSFHVEKLVRDGFLARESIPGDRRLIKLVLTEKSKPVTESGSAVQSAFAEYAENGITNSDMEHFNRIKQLVIKNITDIKEQISKGAKPEDYI